MKKMIEEKEVWKRKRRWRGSVRRRQTWYQRAERERGIARDAAEV